MIDKITRLKKEIEDYDITDPQSLEAFRLEFLSRNGKVQDMFKLMGSVPKEQKAEVGKLMNDVKVLAQNKFDLEKMILPYPLSHPIRDHFIRSLSH